MPNREFYFFLIPQEPLKSKFADIIKRLAITYEATSFIPHTTIYTGPSNKEEAVRISKDIVRKFAPIELQPETITYTQLFYKTAFVQFYKSGLAEELCETIRRAVNTPSAYVLNSHLSLIYKKMPEYEQKKLCSTIVIPQGAYRFTALHVVEALTEETQAGVASWQTVFEADLHGPLST